MMPEKTLNHLVVKLIFDYAVRYNEIMEAARIYLEQREEQRLEAARMWEDGMMRLAEDLEKERSN